MLKLSFVLVLLISFIGCGGLQTRSGMHKSTPKVKDTFGEEAQQDEPISEPESHDSVGPDTGVLPKVGVILGPGGIKTMAHTAVLKELLRARIPIEHIVGLEWGSLVGALYAKKAKIHEAEWQLYRLKKSDLPGKSLFSGGYSAENINKMGKFLNKHLGTYRLQDMAVPFSCPSKSVVSGKLVWQRGGSSRKAIKRCMPYPPLFKPTGSWVAAATSIRESVAYLKKAGAELVIFVDVLGEGEVLSSQELLKEYRSAIIWQEVKRAIRMERHLATEVIDVNTRRFNILNFESRKSLLSAGEVAGRKAADRIVEKYGF